VTGDGLDWALEAAGLGGDDPLRRRLLALYHELEAYPEVPAMLEALRAGGFSTAILSNGSPAMLEAAVAAAGIGEALDAVLSVEEVGVFKPARAVYELVGRRFGTTPAEVLFVSSNGWDVAAGAGFGFATLWVNREGAPQDRLPWAPGHVAADLTGVADLAGRLA
jgi:2-haloacid dehalogenase